MEKFQNDICCCGKTDKKNELLHWKYIKREKVGDKWRYYYDESKGKLNPSSKSDNKSSTSSENAKSSKETKDAKESNSGFDLDEIANKIIKGEFGNGADRKKLLGESYADVQHRVNQILLGEEKAKAILERKKKK